MNNNAKSNINNARKQIATVDSCSLGARVVSSAPCLQHIILYVNMYANDERGECVINSGSSIWHQVAAAVTNAKITQKSVLTHTFSAKCDKRTSHMPHAT